MPRKTLTPRNPHVLAAAPIIGGDIAAGGSTRREHGLTDWVVWHTLSGSCRLIGADGAQVVSHADDVVLIRPQAYQEYLGENAQPWHVRWLVVDPPEAWLPLLQWPEALPGIALVRPSTTASDRIAGHLDDAWRLAAADRMHLAMHACHAALLWLAESRSAHHTHDLIPDPRISRVCEEIRHDPAVMIDLAAAAWRASLSVPHFVRLFRQAHGNSFQRWLEDLRHVRARELLRRSTLSIAEVAKTCGYIDPFYFSARFRLRQGMSPNQYRNRGTR